MKRVLPREEFCITCQLCKVHCQLEHSKSRDLVKAFKAETPRPRSFIRVEEKGPVSFGLACLHCAEPLCVYACFSGALSKNRSTGEVVLDSEKCHGCWSCVMVCPYGALRIDPVEKRVGKCDLCRHRPTPACVEACPNSALSYRESFA